MRVDPEEAPLNRSSGQPASLSNEVTVEGWSGGHIQRALDSLPAGGTVHLPAGRHLIESTVVLPSDVAIVGAGPGSTHVVLAPGAGCHIFTNRDHRRGNENIHLRGFSLDGNMAAQHKPDGVSELAFACGAYLKKVRRVLVEAIEAHQIHQTAFHFNRSREVRVIDVSTTQMGWSGVSSTDTDDLVLTKVRVSGAGLDVRHSGIHLNGGTGAFIEAEVDHCTGNALMLDSKFAPLSDVVIKAVGRSSQRGVALIGGHAHALSNVFVTGEFTDNAECGVLVSNSSHVFVVDATIARNGPQGVVLKGRAGARHCVIAGCTISGHPTAITESGGSQDNSRLDNMTAQRASVTVPGGGQLGRRRQGSSATPPPTGSHETVTVAGRSGRDIQQAVDSLERGGIVRLPAGRYVLDRPVRLASSICVVGEGPDATEIVLGSGGAFHMFTNRDHRAGNHDIELRGVALDGAEGSRTPPFEGALCYAFGIWLKNVTGVVVDEVEARHLAQTAVQLNDCSHALVSDVRTFDMGWSGVATSRTDDLVLRRISVEGAGLVNRHSGIHLGSGIDLSVEAEVSGCTGNALMLDSKHGPLRRAVVRAVGRHSQRGVALIGGAEHPLTDVVLSGTFAENEECGVLISNASRVFVNGATVTGNRAAGVVLQGREGVSHCVMAACLIDDNPVAVVERGASRDNRRLGS